MVRLLRSALSWLAVLGLDGSASSCSLERGAWSPTKSAKRSTLLFAKASVLLLCANTFQNASLYNSQRLEKCNVRVRTRQLGPAQTPTLLTVLHAALCSAGRCAMLRTEQRWVQCSAGRCVMLRAVQRWAQCSAGRSVALRGAYVLCSKQMLARTPSEASRVAAAMAVLR